MVKLALSFATLLLIKYTLAQPGKTDSLLNELAKAKDDTAKVMLLRNIGVTYANQDPRKAIEYWKEGIALSYKLKYIVGLARNYINIGTGYSFLGKYDSTMIYADSGIKYAKLLNDPDRLALAYLNKGDGYRLLRNYKLALIYCDTASIYAARTSNTDRQARIYDIISGIYAEQKQYAAALIVQTKALELYKKDNNMAMVGQVYDDFGLTYQQMGDLDSALIYHKKAIAIGEDVHDDRNLSTYYYGAASIYTDMKNYREAEHFAARSLEYAKEQENNLQLAASYSLLSKIYLAQKKYTEAIQSGNMAYGFSVSEVEPSWQVESAGILAQAYSGTGNYQQAHRFLTISTTIKDSLNRLLVDEEVAKLQSSFELKEKDKEILLLNKDKELQRQKIKQQSLLVAGAVLLALLALTGTWLLVNRNKLKQRMKEMELRNQIAADLHDEVGSSLSSIHMLSRMVTVNDTEGNQKIFWIG